LIPESGLLPKYGDGLHWDTAGERKRSGTPYL
jgi:hypothetical protein